MSHAFCHLKMRRKREHIVVVVALMLFKRKIKTRNKRFVSLYIILKYTLQQILKKIHNFFCLDFYLIKCLRIYLSESNKTRTINDK